MRPGFKHPSTSLSRRELLRMGALGGAIVLQSGARALASRAAGPGRDVLVLVALRGGFDGLSFCVPTGDGDYYAQRPNTGVAAAQTLPLGGLFGLNAAAAPLHGRYQSGQLAFVHACGLAHPTRSHFEATRRVEEASVAGGPVGSGWVGRYLASQAPANPTPGRAIAVDRVLPQAMEGGPATLTIPKLKDFDLEGPAGTKAARAARLRTMYEAREGAERDGGLTALGLLNTLTSIDFAGRTPSGGAVYPGNKFGQGLYETASLIKAQAGIEVVEVDFGGWDDHSSMGAVSGEYAARIQLLAAGLEAFLADLGAEADRTTVIVHSEFGRRVDENGSGGTDHGRGGLVMVLGGSQVRGGQVHGAWPGLAPAVLDDGAVPVRTDIRAVIAATLTERMGASAATLAVTLPGYGGGSSLDLFV